MKKRIVLLLSLALCLFACASALAEGADGRGVQAVQNDGLAAYVDGSGHLRIPGNDEPINERSADSIVSIDPYRLVFLSKTNAGTDQEQTALVVIDLSTYEERVIDNNVYAACRMGADRLYYISGSDRTLLYLADFSKDLVNVAYTSAEPLNGLYQSAEGLVATYVEDAGAVIYVEATNSFEPYGDPVPVKTQMTDEYQVYIADGSTLYVHRPDSLAADVVDTNVFDFALMGGKIYYLANTGSALRVKAYDPDAMEQKVIVTPEISLETQITASQNSVFVLGTDGVVYEVNLETGALDAFLTIQKPQTDADTRVESYSIAGMNGLLNVYARLTSASDAPTFTFMEFTSDVEDADARVVLAHSVALDGEEPAWTLLQPAKQYSPLSRGSRGDAVSAIQQPLYDHGYYDYYIDGIFGYRTDYAVRLLQGDLGLAVNGIADENLQRTILSGNFPTYDPYAALNRGDRGLRVQQMQQRLRSLGYLADGADGIFGARTQAAVQLFQRENNLTVSEGATRETLVKLYAAGTSRCSSYIDLRMGDSGYRVRELNKRLKELFYLDGSVSDTYTTETANAVRRFQAQVGLVIDGTASASLQQRLFAPGAPECSGYSVLRRGDENARVSRLQRRLKELGYFTGNVTGYFGSQTQAAVKLFQQKVGIRPTGVATIRTQELLFSPSAPIYIKPTVIGTPVISIDCFDKRDNGVYYLSDISSATGFVTFTWAAEGDVNRYNVTITDDKGNQILNQDTLLTMTSVSISSLTLDRVYTLRITAYPEDGNASHVTASSLSFCRTEVPDPDEPGTITGVFTSIEPVTRMENDIYYVRPGTLTFRWYAEGDVDSYYVEIRDSKNNVRIHTNTTDEQASISTDVMQEGETYTLCVYAIPTNGTIDDAVQKNQSFALDTELEPVPTVTAPNVTVENLTPDADGAYTLNDSRATLRWEAVENATQYYIEVRDANDAFCLSDTTMATGYVLDASSLVLGASYNVRVTAIPNGGTVEQGATGTVKIILPQDQTVAQLPAPTLSIVGVQPSSNGIAYVNDTALVFQWTNVDGASGYNVVVRDSNNSICSEMTLTQLNTAYDASKLARGAVYTVSVTAVPQEGANAQGTAATLPFIIAAEEAANELTTTGDEPVDNNDQPSAPEASAAAEAPAETEDPDKTEAPADSTEAPSADSKVSVPEITLTAIDEVVDSVTYVQEGAIGFAWHSEGDLSGYCAEILDSSGNVLTSMTTESEGASLSSDNLAPEAIYILRVTAIPADGTVADGAAAEVRFAKHGQSTEPVEAADIPAEAPAEEPQAPAEPAQAPEEPDAAPIGSASAPVLDIQPAVQETDSVTYVQEGTVTLAWRADGDVSGYRVEILDAGNVIASMDTQETSTGISTSNMTPGTVYTLRVTAIPTGGTVDDGVSSERSFALLPQTEEPAEEPISAGEPAEQPAEEPTAPDEEPAGQPAEEPAEPAKAPIGTVSAPTLDIQPIVQQSDGVSYVANGTINLNWSADGDVSGYRVEVLDSGNVIASMDTQETSTGIPSANLAAGTVYTLRVTAIPTGGTVDDGAASEMRFALQPQEVSQPAQEPDSYEEPAQEPDSYETPAEEPAQQPDSYETPAEEPAQEPAAQPELPAEQPAPASTDPWAAPIDLNSDPALIAQVQQRLLELQWLLPDTYMVGVLDEATVTAVNNFQMDFNANNYSGNLIPIDPELPIIDVETLTMLFGVTNN